MPLLSDHTLQRIKNAADTIYHAKQAVVLSGAGISTPSGIADFRSAKSGLWQRYDPFEVASLNSFRYNPEKFFNWMRPLAADIFHATPNAAHVAIADLEKNGFIKQVITQNIDGLHQKAGSMNVIEVHGSLETLSCIHCFQVYPGEGYIDDYIENGVIPRCPECQGVLKPDVILFGEQLPSKAWLKANQISKQCDLMIVVGSSLEVLPVAGLPMRAIENGAHLIIINNSQTYMDVRADVVFAEDVITILPEISRQLLDH